MQQQFKKPITTTTVVILFSFENKLGKIVAGRVFMF